MRFVFALFLALFSSAAFAGDIQLHLSNVERVDARIIFEYTNADRCQRYYLSGNIIQSPEIDRHNVSEFDTEPKFRRIAIANGMSFDDKECNPGEGVETVIVKSYPFYIEPVNGDVNVTFNLPDGYGVETDVKYLPQWE